MAKKVSLSQILNFILSKHGLISRLSSYDSSSMLPLHATNITTPYLSLLARIKYFGDNENNEKDKKEIEGWKNILHSPSVSSFSLRRCMRGTLHLIPRNLIDVIVCIYGEKFVDDEDGENKKRKRKDEESENREEEEEEEEEEIEEKVTGDSKILKFHKIPQEEADELAVHILDAIKNHGPQTSVTIKKHIPADLVKIRKTKWNSTANIGPVMKYLYQAGKLEYGVPPVAAPAKKKQKKETKQSETKKKTENKEWRSSIRLFGLAPYEKSKQMEIEKAMEELAKWYFRLYSPAAFEDFVWWTGLSTSLCRVAFDSIKAELAEVKSDGIDEKMYIFKNELDSLLKSPTTSPSMARLLPYEDALLKAYKVTRHRFFGNGNVHHIISTDGVARPTVWMDGSVVGVWQWTNKPGQNIKITLFNNANEDSGKEKGKQKSKAKGKEENTTEIIKQRLIEELDIVGKFIESKNVDWECL